MVSVREFSSENLSEVNVLTLPEKTRMKREVTVFTEQLKLYEVAGENGRQVPYESWYWKFHPGDIMSQMKPTTGNDSC